MHILLFLLTFWIGFFVGIFIVKLFLKDGVLVVKKEDGKIIYSLELADNPEKLQYKKSVRFKVVKPNDELVRK